MKINELIKEFEVYTSNEEKRVLEQLTHVRQLSSFSERDQFTIESLIRKSLVIKVGHKDPMIVINEK